MLMARKKFLDISQFGSIFHHQTKMRRLKNMTNCKNCDRSLEPTENDAGHSSAQLQRCHDQYLTKICKKWGIIATATFVACFLVGQVASAETQVQIIAPDGTPLTLTSQNVQVLSLQQGAVYTGSVNEPTTVTGSVQSLFSTIGNGGQTTFTFKVAPYATNLVIGQGSNQQTFIVQPQTSTLPDGINVTDLILICVVVAVVVIAGLVYRVRRQ
ncbi:MAG: hypothetical protein ACREOZ_04580 [Gloeomargaritales cyanobacterium]